MIALIVILILAGIAALLGCVWFWFAAFAAGMSDNPQAAADMTPSSIVLFGLPVLAIALFVAAWWFG